MKRIEEPEFIVSSEELRKNRERVLLREQQERDEKKENIFTILGAIVLIILMILIFKSMDIQYDKEVAHCVAAGNSEQFCKIHLR